MTTGRINQVATNHEKLNPFRREETALMFAICVCGISIASLHQFRNCLVPLLRSSVCAQLETELKRRQKNGLFSTSAVDWTTALSGASNLCCLDGWSNHWSIQLQKEYRSSRVGRRSIRWKSKKRKANQWFANQAFARCHLEAEELQLERFYETEEKLN